MAETPKGKPENKNRDLNQDTGHPDVSGAPELPNTKQVRDDTEPMTPAPQDPAEGTKDTAETPEKSQNAESSETPSAPALDTADSAVEDIVKEEDVTPGADEAKLDTDADLGADLPDPDATISPSVDTELPEASGDPFRTPEEAAAEDATRPDAEPVAPAVMPVRQDKSFKRWVKTHKKTVVLLAMLLVIAALAAVPWTRYKIAGSFMRQSQTIQVVDSETKKPVTGAMVFVGDRSKVTDSKGKVTLDPKVGNQDVVVMKPNFQKVETKKLIPLLDPKDDIQISLKATGRQVGVKVVNSLTGKAIENADIDIKTSQFKTDSKGEATIVAPAESKEVEATITAANYVKSDVKILINAQTLQIQTFKLVPSGKIYFLSNLSGKIDVVKANLDGSSREVVLAGTGSEDPHGTALLASRDWKYLVLLSKRDGGKNDKVFLINTATGKATTVDEGDAAFNLVGWHNHTFVYSVYRNGKQQWDGGRQALKSYNAESGKMVTLEENQTNGNQQNYAYQVLGNYYIVNSGLVYTVNWDIGNSWTYRGDYLNGKLNAIRTINVDGTNKKDVKTFDAMTTGSMSARAYAPDEIYVSIYDYDKKGNAFFEYEDGSVKDASVDDSIFNKQYATYLFSPNGSQTFWSEGRDGKNSLFVGDKDGKNGQQVASLSDYAAYGWYTDDYLLLAKSGSELYIMPKTGGQPVKITDYYKPNLNFYGYGYGYGGI